MIPRHAGRFLIGDLLLLVGSVLAAALLRFDGRVPADIAVHLPLVIIVSVLVKVPVFARQRLYAMHWSQVSLEEMVAVFRAVTFSSAIFWVIIFALKRAGTLAGFPRSVLLLDYIITLYAIGLFRMGWRVYGYLVRSAAPGGRRALIVGAGAAGVQLLRALRETPASGYSPVGLVDDDPGKIGTTIHGLAVMGDRSRLPALIRDHAVRSVLIAIPSAPSRVMRNIISLARDAGVEEIRVIPGLHQLLNGKFTLQDLREVQLGDLLGREMVRIDTGEVGTWLASRTVLVTGAGGSIGSELCRQIAAFRPPELALVDFDESELFWVHQQLQRTGARVTALIGDVRSPQRMREIFARVRPQVVFHAAAYKHVGLMEHHPEEAVATNILGALTVARASIEAGVEKCVLISTDKAVNPTSVMGVTKRVAEEVCLALDTAGRTRFMAVRFGNVLGSRGSVLPLFQERIRRGEPLVVRGPEMRRYFMAVDEAVLLVLQTGLMGHGGEVFVLDMGEPVRILDLAREFIRLSGLEPDRDVPIVFADPEPGEKEHEELLTAEEGTIATRHDRIFVALTRPAQPADVVVQQVERLAALLNRRDLPAAVRLLREIVPSYRPSELLAGERREQDRLPS